MADSVDLNEIAKWLDESVPEFPRDTDTVSGIAASLAQAATENSDSRRETPQRAAPVAATDAADDAGEQSASRPSYENPTILLKDSADHPDGQAVGTLADASTEEEDASPAESGDGSLTQYNSAVNYISDLIEQLRIPEPAHGTAATPDQLGESPRTEQTNVLGHDDLHSLGIGSTMPLTPDLAGVVQSATQGGSPELIDEVAEQGYAYRRSLMRSLREAAHLATNTSLELNDCARFAHRAYYAGFFGCASAFFSIVFVLMSPKTATFGFAASVGAFALACCLATVYVLSYRAFLRKAGRVRSTRAVASPNPDAAAT